MDEAKAFFNRLCSCDSANVRSNKRLERECKPGCSPNQKAFVVMLFERISEEIEKRRINKNEDSPESMKKEICVVVEDEPKPEPCVVEAPKMPDKNKLCEKKEVKKPKVKCFECYIKEQNPLAPACCRSKSEVVETPCPPPEYQQDYYRPPCCGCDYCRTSGYHGQCCDPRNFDQDDMPRLESA